MAKKSDFTRVQKTKIMEASVKFLAKELKRHWDNEEGIVPEKRTGVLFVGWTC